MRRRILSDEEKLKRLDLEIRQTEHLLDASLYVLEEARDERKRLAERIQARNINQVINGIRYEERFVN